MTTVRRAAPTPRHSPEIVEVHRRMLCRAGVDGQFVRRPSGSLVHVVMAGEGPAVVHLHGMNTSSLSHLMLLGRTPGTRSYLVDRPGLGLSDPESAAPAGAREAAVGFVGDVLDALDLDAAVLVGASGGGVWATWFALAHPERVRGLVMLGAVPTLPGSRAPAPFRVAAAPGVGDVLRRVPAGRRAMATMMASMGEGETIRRHPDLLDALVAGARDPVASAANLAELRSLISPRGIRPEVRLTHDELRLLSVRTLMIWGNRDPVVPLARAREIATALPDARLEVLDAGHVPQLGHPGEVAELLRGLALSR